jgi:hypothetical protein
VNEGLFAPNQGYSLSRVFACEDGIATEIFLKDIERMADFETCVIKNYSARKRYDLSEAIAPEITECVLMGYTAHAAPFDVRVAQGNKLEPYNIAISGASQILRSKAVRPINFTVHTADISITDRDGFQILEPATAGLSGGPMLNAKDGKAVGICFMGQPADQFRKDWIGVLDIRKFPFIR